MAEIWSSPMLSCTDLRLLRPSRMFPCRRATLCITFCGHQQREHRIQSRLDGAVFVWGRRCVTRRWYPSRRSFAACRGTGPCAQESHALINCMVVVVMCAFFARWLGDQKKIKKYIQQVVACLIKKKSGLLPILWGWGGYFWTHCQQKLFVSRVFHL